MLLRVNDLSCHIGDVQILKGISLEVEQGEFVGLIGPNGCGKTTLLKNICRSYKPRRDAVYIGDKDVTELTSRKLAKELAVMSQENNVEFDIAVLDMVLYGRYAHRRFLEGEKKEDIELCYKVIADVGLKGYEKRSYLSLSGGEKQRVLLARALVQESRLIALDEPTNHLDVKYQYQIMQKLKESGVTVFSSIHDLNLAAMYCDRILLMNHGVIVASGIPAEVITAENILKYFEIQAEVKLNQRNNKLQVYYYGI